MLELLMLSLCFGSEMSSEACSQAYTKYMNENPATVEQINTYERVYGKRLPVELLWVGSAAGFVYKRQVKLGLTRTFYLEVRDQGYGGLGFKKEFP